VLVSLQLAIDIFPFPDADRDPAFIIEQENVLSVLSFVPTGMTGISYGYRHAKRTGRKKRKGIRSA
jgi:hypothetical protein